MKYFILFFTLFFIASSHGQAQKILALDVNSKRIKYTNGDYLAIKVINDKTVFKGYLDIVSDSTFLINANMVHIDSVTAIIKYNKAPKNISKQAFLVAGLTAIISGLNNGLTKGEVFPGDNSYIVPGVFAGIGAIMLPFWKKTYKLNNKRSIQILDLTPVPIDEGQP